MNVILQRSVGGIIGWVASMVMKTNAQMGVIANVVVGIVGAAIGGWLGGKLGIGGGAIILPGVTVGDDAIIGAGSVVTRDVPEGVLAVGNPCRVVRAIP